jgi:preprotein translocase subunit SecD
MKLISMSRCAHLCLVLFLAPIGVALAQVENASQHPIVKLNVADAMVSFRRQEALKAVVGVRLTEQGSQAFRRFTLDHVGQIAEFIVGDQIIMAARINEPILGGFVLLSGDFTDAQAVNLARQLNTTSDLLGVAGT